MTPETDTEAIRSAHWQGVISTKIDNLTGVVKEMAEDKATTHAELSARIDSLESTRDRALGALFGAAAIGGVLGGGVSSLISYLVT